MLVSCKSNFHLKASDPLHPEVGENGTGNTADRIYAYLTKNYDSISNKTDIKKLESYNDRICSFSQKFENNIEFSNDSCQESGGIRANVKFPKVDKKEITEWIERFSSSQAPGSSHHWNGQRTTYEPDAGQAINCYYELVDLGDSWRVVIFCG